MKILESPLTEQVFPDSAHFQLSPMYHNILLCRLLDCYNLVKNNERHQPSVKMQLANTVSIMYGWLLQMSFKDGSLAKLGDSADGIAPVKKDIDAYIQRLAITGTVIPLKESGYRKINGDNYEMIADIGHVGPSYIPGHAHSDTLSFILNISGKPFLIDTGISTYEKHERRNYERSSFAHNTVGINDANS